MAVEPERMQDAPLVALLRAARATYGMVIRKALAESGYDDVPPNGLFVLGGIAQPGAPLAEIIGQLGVSKQAAGQLIDTLVVRGYLDRSVDPDDRRRLRIALTERGEGAAAIIRAANERIDDALLASVGPEYVAHTRATLAAVIAGETAGA